MLNCNLGWYQRPCGLVRFQACISISFWVYKNVCYQHIKDVKHHQIYIFLLLVYYSWWRVYVWSNLILCRFHLNASGRFGRFIGALFWEFLTAVQWNEYCLCDTYSTVQCYSLENAHPDLLGCFGTRWGGRTRSANWFNIITQPVWDEEAQKDSSFVYSQSMLEEPDVQIPGKDGFSSRVLEMSKLRCFNKN